VHSGIQSAIDISLESQVGRAVTEVTEVFTLVVFGAAVVAIPLRRPFITSQTFACEVWICFIFMSRVCVHGNMFHASVEK